MSHVSVRIYSKKNNKTKRIRKKIFYYSKAAQYRKSFSQRKKINKRVSCHDEAEEAGTGRPGPKWTNGRPCLSEKYNKQLYAPA
jgi:hypothetical protein